MDIWLFSESKLRTKFDTIDGEVADDGKTYNYKFYGLKAVIAVGYKVNSQANA